MACKTGCQQERVFSDWVDFFRKSKSSFQYDSNSDPPPKPVSNTNLAAFISLWICSFIMPYNHKVIRPGVFMIACNLVHGRPVAFAPAVLARLYIGLNSMVNHRKGPVHSTVVFPSHFLYAWASCHFHGISLRRKIDEGTHTIPGLSRIPEMLYYMNASASFFTPLDARKFLRYETNFKWHPFPYLLHNDKTVRDTRHLAGPDVLDLQTMEYVIGLRCGILPLRCDGEFYAEPYNPHRFGRQFGYNQQCTVFIDVPRRASSARVLAGYWRHFSRQKTSSSFYIPEQDRNGELMFFYARKWLENVRAFFQQNIASLVREDYGDRNREQSQPSRRPRFINESIFISHKRGLPPADPPTPVKRRQTQGVQIHEVPLANVRVGNSPIAPRIGDASPPDPRMPLESQVGSVSPQDFNVGAERNIRVEEAFPNPTQDSDIPIAESAAPPNLPVDQESDERTSSFNNIPSATFIRDAPTSVEKLEIDGGNANIESAPLLAVQDPTEGAESSGSNAEIEIANSPKQNQGDEPPSTGQAPSKDITEDAAPAPAPGEGDGGNIDVGLATSSKQGQGPRNIPSMVLHLRDEVISSIKSLNYDNYQSIINKVKESNSLLEPFGIGLTLEPFIEGIARCAAYAKEASEDPNVQTYLCNQQAQACVHEKTLALEHLSKSREGWADDINRDKEEFQKLAEKHQKLQAKLCEIQDAMKTLSERMATSTNFFEASEPAQTDLQAELDRAKAQVIEDQGDYSDATLKAIFTKWLDELEEAKESLMKSAGH